MRAAIPGLLALLSPGCMMTLSEIVVTRHTTTTRLGLPEASFTRPRIETSAEPDGSLSVNARLEQFCPRVTLKIEERKKITREIPAVGVWMWAAWTTALVVFSAREMSAENLLIGVLGGPGVLVAHLPLSSRTEQVMPPAEYPLEHTWESCFAHPYGGASILARSGNTIVSGVADAKGKARLAPAPAPTAIFFVGGEWVPARSSALPAPPPPPSAVPVPKRGPRHGGVVFP